MNNNKYQLAEPTQQNFIAPDGEIITAQEVLDLLNKPVKGPYEVVRLDPFPPTVRDPFGEFITIDVAIGVLNQLVAIIEDFDMDDGPEPCGDTPHPYGVSSFRNELWGDKVGQYIKEAKNENSTRDNT